MSRYDYQVNLGMFRGTNFEVITLTTAASTGFTAASYGSLVVRALVTTENNQIRYRYDGVAPTVSTGHLSDPGTVVGILGLNNVQNFQAIAVTATATLMVTYERDNR